MRHKGKSDETAPAPSTSLQSPHWVIAMHEHFQKAGYFRAEDVHRVLGDPRESVRLAPDPNVPLVARVKK